MISTLTQAARAASKDIRRQVIAMDTHTVHISPMATDIFALTIWSDRGVIKRKDVPLERVDAAYRAMEHEYQTGEWMSYR